MRKVVVANIKGGSGKTTIATCLAAWWACANHNTGLLDLDPQGAARSWLGRRPHTRPGIHGLALPARSAAVTASFAMRIPPTIERLVVDTAAGLARSALGAAVQSAAAVLIPVLPGEMDSAAADRTIADLLPLARQGKYSGRIAVVANRVKRRTLGARRLERFMASLDIPLVTTLHDAQAYTHAMHEGLGVGELKSYRIGAECEAWQPLLGWLETCAAETVADTALAPRNLPLFTQDVGGSTAEP